MPPAAFAVSGPVEWLPFNDQFMLSMERSFSVGAPGTGNTIKLNAVAIGPDLPDGRRSLALVSDNNFSPTQFTQFLLFALE